MARLQVDPSGGAGGGAPNATDAAGPTLRLDLSHWEALGALHGSLSAPLAQVASCTAVQDPWARAGPVTGAGSDASGGGGRVLRGWRAPGTGLPGVIALGTLRHSGGRDFAAVYRHRPAVVVDFSAGPWGRWVVTAAGEGEAERLAAEVTAAAAAARG
ncbi:hypothetical protein MNEG_9804 [Monoraphidium neglectum]|jgi:hypothetical protein|uniref:Uncharacterized protein n=1 Tax=Monoraphidium neglectum TaxID=145388 RepID=A0A0D2JFC4_9CHLO|nr:hypothetical protein MNEG_9804 [Monoraphidium neglectum]KIY98157.1 hypothetical protein MNEG_9804 [Monoraphidium neglectum]|eukprot:XP_013897177.1 hypothetical protein MNEG_9804 [Monoraphidium neglectum]